MNNDVIDLEEAIDLIRVEYEIAKGLEYVRHPLSWAVYQIWLVLDEMDNRRALDERRVPKE